MLGKALHHIFFSNSFNKFNNTGALMYDPLYLGYLYLFFKLCKAFAVYKTKWVSCDMIKPTEWVCIQRTQISLGISPVWSESSLSAWRNLGPLAAHWAQSEDWSDWADAQADLRLRWAHSHFDGFFMSRLICWHQARTWLFKLLWSTEYMLWWFTESSSFLLPISNPKQNDHTMIKPPLNPPITFQTWVTWSLKPPTKTDVTSQD